MFRHLWNDSRPRSVVWNNLQQTPVSNDIVAPISGREGERMKSIDGPELSAPYLYHTALSLHNYDWSDISVLLAAPLYSQLVGVQAHSSDREVLKGVVTQSSHWWMPGRWTGRMQLRARDPRDPTAVTLQLFQFGSLGAPSPLCNMCEGSPGVGCKRPRGDLLRQETTTTFIHGILISTSR